MKTFRIVFEGRERGAIGVLCRYTETVTANDEESARVSLYDYYDHIRVISVVELG